jgi:hypothetical protein
MISYSVYCSLKEQICRNANLPLDVSLTEWRELMLRYPSRAGENLDALRHPLLYHWLILRYAFAADSVPQR